MFETVFRNEHTWFLDISLNRMKVFHAWLVWTEVGKFCTSDFLRVLEELSTLQASNESVILKEFNSRMSRATDENKKLVSKLQDY